MSDIKQTKARFVRNRTYAEGRAYNLLCRRPLSFFDGCSEDFPRFPANAANSRSNLATVAGRPCATTASFFTIADFPPHGRRIADHPVLFYAREQPGERMIK